MIMQAYYKSWKIINFHQYFCVFHVADVKILIYTSAEIGNEW